MFSRTLKSSVMAVAAAATVLVGATTSAAAGGVPWKVDHGTATAEGTRWLEKGEGVLYSNLVIKGELKNTGSDCYSVWFQFNYDMAPGPGRKHATQCGPGTVEVNFTTMYRPLTTGSVYICKDEPGKGCGQSRTITSWPIQKPAG
ncbi:hypothetical protein OG625_17220 [Streptomyces sp. NBC_01351]|uniref:hypothetical protein n=1 Tax=Streptomyces sp. NBC_01351 TaxID=2903833 RepID=UPI002E380B07|nr:hypothetical protein [Streptomyces sp. NBC_01351]